LDNSVCRTGGRSDELGKTDAASFESVAAAVGEERCGKVKPCCISSKCSQGKAGKKVREKGLAQLTGIGCSSPVTELEEGRDSGAELPVDIDHLMYWKLVDVYMERTSNRRTSSYKTVHHRTVLSLPAGCCCSCENCNTIFGPSPFSGGGTPWNACVCSCSKTTDWGSCYKIDSSTRMSLQGGMQGSHRYDPCVDDDRIRGGNLSNDASDFLGRCSTASSFL